MTTISLCLIVRNEEDNIGLALAGIQEYVDEICITDTGSTDKTIEVIKSLPYASKIKLSECSPKTHPENYFEDGHIRSFARVRQFNFDQATKDWILWMDADDVFRGQENLRKTVEDAEKIGIHGMFLQYEYICREDGRADEIHWKLQLAKRGPYFKWLGNVHEDYLPQTPETKIARATHIVRVHERGVHDDGSKAQRNLRILNADLQEQGENPDPRTLFYLARTFLVLDMWEEAIPVLEKYESLTGWPEERHEGLYLLGECYLQQNRPDDAMKIAYKMMDMFPNFSESFSIIGRALLTKKEFAKAEIWLERAVKNGPSKGAITNFPLRYTAQPTYGLAIAKLNQNKIEEALQLAEEALKYDKTNDIVGAFVALCKHLKDKRDIAMSYARVCAYLNEKKNNPGIVAVLGTIPQELQADPLIARLRNEWTPPKKWEKGSVVIAAMASVEAWSPQNEKKGGIGGSEEAIINISRELNELGYKVTVYTNTGSMDGDYDGVTWKMYTEMNPNDEFDTLILWRAVGLLDRDWKANTLLFDLHDVPFIVDWPKERQDKVHKLMVKSQYHRSLFTSVPDEKFVIVGNGLVPEHFKKKVKREKNRCFYSSAIDRGLDWLLEMWPKIREQVPDATLHVYYGWVTYEMLNKHNPERMKFMYDIKAKLAELEPLGVIWHDRVDHETLAEDMLKSDVWLYPTRFPEISCITAMKAQAAGAIPICSDFAALNETVQHGKKLPLDMRLQSSREAYVEEVVKTLKDEKYKEDTRKDMMQWARDNFAWSKVAQVWSDTIKANEKES